MAVAAAAGGGSSWQLNVTCSGDMFVDVDVMHCPMRLQDWAPESFSDLMTRALLGATESCQPRPSAH